MRKGQTALEYLMTYGWAILIVIIVVAALYALGLTKPCRWTGTQVSGFGQFYVDRNSVKMTQVAGTDDNKLVFKLTNNNDKQIKIAANNLVVKHAPSGKTGSNANEIIIDAYQAETVDITIDGSNVAKGDCYTVDVEFTYEIGGEPHTAGGTLSGMVE